MGGLRGTLIAVISFGMCKPKVFMELKGKNPAIYLGVLSIIFSLLYLSPVKQIEAAVKNGFNLDGALVPQTQIFQGGPPKDGIPSIDSPKFLTVDKAAYLESTDRVLGVVVDGVAKAYPIRILNWHEIVNDKVGSTPFVVTFCPLCGTGVVFSAKDKAGNRMMFGVSGLLYNSDVLLYDRKTESLWSQIMGQAVSGEQKGNKLKKLPVAHTSWEDWKNRYPKTLVLSTQTGARRDYNRDPYSGYERSERTFFPVENRAPSDYHPKERVVGLEINGVYKAYPFVELAKSGKKSFQDRVNGKNVTVHWDGLNANAWVLSNGDEIPTIIGFWFAWYAFHPNTAVYKSNL